MTMVTWAYQPPEDGDGCRSNDYRCAAVDHGFKSLAPSAAMRRWFGHGPDKWEEFRRRYRTELDANATALAPLCETLEEENTVTLLFAARAEAHNNAVVLAGHLRGRRAK